MPAVEISTTDYGLGRVLVEIRGKSIWYAFLRQQQDGTWRAWLHEGGLSAMSEGEALAWAERCADALEHPPRQ